MLQYWSVVQCWCGLCCIPLQCLALKGGSFAQTSRVSVLDRHTTLCHQALYSSDCESRVAGLPHHMKEVVSLCGMGLLHARACAALSSQA